MQRIFSDRFDFHNWQGIRAAQFRTPNDAFQQLVGDGLKAQFRASAWIAPTAGRDGGIDAWVDCRLGSPQEFSALGEHFIVECKWHDAEAKDPTANIQQEWRRVAEKLIKQAAAGWPGAYEPWKKATGYIYCIGMRFPGQAVRESLCEAIRDFFDRLPPGQRPPIAREAVHVWDWSDLAAWLRHFPRLADLWLGIPTTDLVDHATYRQRVGRHDAETQLGFRGYLLAENLPFIPPSDDNECHPDRLLVRLQRNENILLLGEGGIGKTRTAFEVAERADQAGWRVLHLDPPEGGIDPRSLLGELAGPGNTLVVVDYIDKIPNFDARYWRNTLLPEVARRQGRLQLIANARPADSENLLRAIQESALFAAVRLEPSLERRRAVVAAIEARLCPRALSALGEARVRELCGSRPIIAMFVARELEALVTAGLPAGGLDNAPRPGDLVGWLSRRLADAELLHRPAGSRWDASAPQPGLCAAVAVLAAAPLWEIELTQVAAATLAAAGGDPAQAQRCVDLLRRSGWLEGSEGTHQLRTPHDIVADETLTRLLAVEIAALPWLLAAASQGRPLGRFALALGRLSGHRLLDAGGIAAAKGWLEAEADRLGSALTNIPPDLAAYALGAVFDCPYWAESATARWADLVTPWLRTFGSDACARHLLHRGLGMRGGPADLGDASLAWLSLHGAADVASFVLSPLLAWDAGRLGDDQNAARDFAIEWLDAHGTTEAAGFVLHSLLAWDAGRLGDDQNAARDFAIEWLDGHGTAEAAGYVLAPLLAWDAGRLGDDQNAARDFAIKWLDAHGTTQAAQFVLHSLLDWDAGRLGDDQNAARDFAIKWLASPHGTSEAAGYVLPPLLAWDAARLGDDQNATRDFAIKWLDAHGTTEAAAFVLDPLLRWDADRLGDDQNAARDFAIKWLDAHRTTEAGQFVLDPLLAWEADRLGKDASKVIALALSWLTAFHASDKADFVLAGLVNRPGLDATARGQCADWALAWLDRHLKDAEATHLLRALLQASNWYSTQVDAPRVIILAGRWLDHHRQHAERPFVMARLLRLPLLPDRAWLHVAVRALEELDRRAGDAGDDYLLSSVLNRLVGLREEHCALWLRLTRRWIRHHGSAGAAGYLMWNCSITSSRMIDACFASLLPDCIERFGPDFEVGR